METGASSIVAPESRVSSRGIRRESRTARIVAGVAVAIGTWILVAATPVTAVAADFPPEAGAVVRVADSFPWTPPPDKAIRYETSTSRTTRSESSTTTRSSTFKVHVDLSPRLLDPEYREDRRPNWHAPAPPAPPPSTYPPPLPPSLQAPQLAPPANVGPWR